MISLFYITDDDGKVRIRNSGMESFDSFNIRYIVFSSNSASAYFLDLSGNEIARILIDLKYDRELFDVANEMSMLRTKSPGKPAMMLRPLSREGFIDWLRENHPDILTYLLWYIA